MSDVKKTILDSIDDVVGDFMYYDRKEDEDLPLGAIEEALKAGDITYNEIVDRFKQKIYEVLSL